ncbi:DNA cross-link repair 1A protein-like [Fundulus heteroclitus]|uniref:DNA cross-link repair 1A protein-like n=1 Tax=Fundulus heteroclitus TaxID=8078 RepID=UPI00165B4B90|nr:DNA cross-link repair 1A protein-like [Fundulus heteroclitus]
MSQRDDSEDDIWEYKPLEKKRKSSKSPRVCRRTSAPRKTPKNAAPLSVGPKTEQEAAGDPSAVGDASVLLSGEPPITSPPAEGPTSGRYCPICQMPFCILVVQSQRWHVAECLDTPRDKCGECPDGLRCSSTLPNHYKRFNHTLLAESRASGAAAAPGLSRQTDAGGEATLGRFQEAVSFPSDPSPGRAPASPRQNHAAAPPSEPANGLLMLRSPGPDDFKKKKGWLRSNKGQKAAGASQGKTDTSSTPVKESAAAQASSAKEESFHEDDDGISYSPLSELPAEPEVGDNCRKSLFPNGGSEHERSVMLFSDSFSSEDEILAEFIDNNCEDHKTPTNDPSSSSQLYAVSSLAPTNEQAGPNRADAEARSPSGSKTSSSGLQSPQRIVLERLRESLGQKPRSPPVSTSQDSSVTKQQPMPPQKGQAKAGQAPGLKQTDIGVFFGLKPLRATETESGQHKPDASSAPASGKNPGRGRRRGDGRGRGQAEPAAEASQAAGLADDSSSAGVAGRGGNRRWRRRWSRADGDGEVQLPRCPFYKKIPGTKFVVDAFRYGEIQGISTYFLTHFHSDHYGGLTKSSTFPIYCNRITGNLVKSKLRVAEQYVHILPMNTEVEVDGVRVILLDANHCPGAAMLLFFLPDGQTVLHTGDFRADPSMENLPSAARLPGSDSLPGHHLTAARSTPSPGSRSHQLCRQHGLRVGDPPPAHPRGVWLVLRGEEKVFLALAEVLGSKVCLSRDKYNTMCCLESQQIKERITTDWKAAQVHVLPMMQLSFNYCSSTWHASQHSTIGW